MERSKTDVGLKATHDTSNACSSVTISWARQQDACGSYANVLEYYVANDSSTLRAIPVPPNATYVKLMAKEFSPETEYEFRLKSRYTSLSGHAVQETTSDPANLYIPYCRQGTLAGVVWRGVLVAPCGLHGRGPGQFTVCVGGRESGVDMVCGEGGGSRVWTCCVGRGEGVGCGHVVWGGGRESGVDMVCGEGGMSRVWTLCGEGGGSRVWTWCVVLAMHAVLDYALITVLGTLLAMMVVTIFGTVLTLLCCHYRW